MQDNTLRVLEIGDLILEKPEQKTSWLPALVTRVFVDHVRRCSSTRYSYTFTFLDTHGLRGQRDIYLLEPNEEERTSWPARSPGLSHDGRSFVVSARKIL